MDNIRILVVENDLSMAIDIEMMISEIGYTFLGRANNAVDALRTIKANRPDLIIMDIGLEGTKDGIEVANSITSLQIPIIFITAYRDKEIFKRAKTTTLSAYLIKPFQMLTLRNTIELALLKRQKELDLDEKQWNNNISPNGVVFIKMNKIIRKFFVRDILWVEVNGNYSYLYTNEKKYVLKTSLKKVMEKINEHAQFMRVHKQFIVQTKYIDTVDITNGNLRIKDKEIPIGRKYKSVLLEKLGLR